MLTRDIHSNLESVDTAIYDLKQTIVLARKSKDKVLCIIVGYGSTGKTHKIQRHVLEALEILKQQNQIKEYIRGNELDIFNVNYQKLKYGHLIPEKEKRIKNPGAIYIIV